MARVTGVVLCGGRGQRMGRVDKPLMQLGRETMIETVLKRVEPQVESLMISCADNANAYQHLGYPIVEDHRTDAGPLAGIEASLLRCQTDLLFVCPGDAPGLPADLVRSLQDGLGDHDLAIPNDGTRNQHLFMLLKRDVVNILSEQLNAGIRRVADFVSHVRAISVRAHAPEDFQNLNTPRDLAIWKTRN